MGVRELSVRVRPSRSVTRLVEMMLLEGMGWTGGGVTAGWGEERINRAHSPLGKPTQGQF